MFGLGCVIGRGLAGVCDVLLGRVTTVPLESGHDMPTTAGRIYASNDIYDSTPNEMRRTRTNARVRGIAIIITSVETFKERLE